MNRAIFECLERLADAEKTLADVRSVLSDQFNTPRCGDEYENGPTGAQLDEDIRLGRQEQSTEATSEARSPDNIILALEEVTFRQTDTLLNSLSKLKTLTNTDEMIDPEVIKSQFPELARKHQLSEERVGVVYEIFAAANHSASGLLSLDELAALLVDMCDGTIEQAQVVFIMDKFDTNKDCKLNFEEFINAFVSTPLMKASHLHGELKAKGGDARTQIKEGKIRMQASDWVLIMGCKADSVKRYVKKELSEAGSCVAMPLVFAMFVLFFLSSFLHLGYEQLHSVDKAIYFDIIENANFAFGGDIPFENGRMGHKNIYDVNSFADFWSWLDLGIVPIFWAEQWELSETRTNVMMRCTTRQTALNEYGWNSSTFNGTIEPLGTGVNTSLCPKDPVYPKRPAEYYNAAEAGVYLYYNSVVAGVRMRQERSDPEECPNDDISLKSALHQGLCVPDVGYSLEPELHAALHTDLTLVDRPGGRTVYLKSLESQKDIRAKLRQLEDEVWLGPYTAKVEILLTTYNANLDVFSATYVWVFVNRGGHMHKVLEPISTYLTTYRQPMSYVTDVLLLVLSFKILAEEGYQIFCNMRQLGICAGFRDYLCPSNFIDCLSVVVFAVQIGVWLRHVKKIANLQDAMRAADPNVPGSFANAEDHARFYDTVDDWVISDNRLRIVLAVFPFIIGMRFFKVFSLQPRLGVVTATLKNATVDIVHFMMVFGSIFLVFVTAAMILFGQEIDDFTNFGRATMTVYRIMLGDYDWDELIRVGRQQTGLWFWTFTWLVNLIMLNMLLAIVMDVYTSVKAGINADAETMWSQASEIISRWWHVKKGHQVSLEVILEHLEAHSEKLTKPDETDDGRLTVSKFMDLVPSMPEDQAAKILVNAYASDEESLGSGGSTGETSTRVRHILANTQTLHDAIEQLTHLNEVMAEMINANFAEMRYHSHQNKNARGEPLSPGSPDRSVAVGDSTRDQTKRPNREITSGSI